MEEMEASSKSLIVIVSWLDLRMVTIHDLVSLTQADDMAKVH